MQAQYRERMKAIVSQAVAEAYGQQLSEVHLIVYGDINKDQIKNIFVEASQGTQAEGVTVIVHSAGSRYICWNCCGLRFESTDDVCPNCGELAIEVPKEIAFALRQIDIKPD